MEIKENGKVWQLNHVTVNPWYDVMVHEGVGNIICPHDMEHRIRWPLLMSHLKAMYQLVKKQGNAATFVLVRDVCAIWLGFYAMLRCAEEARLDLTEVKVMEADKDREKRVRVWVKVSKTDPDGVGEWITCQGEELVQIVKQYQQMRGKQAGPFLVKAAADRTRAETTMARKTGKQQKKKGIQLQKGSKTMWLPQASSAPRKPVSTQAKQQSWGIKKATLTWRLRELLKKIGVPEAELAYYAWHSCRSGGATEALRQGVPIEQLKRQGRWKSDAVEVYLWLAEQEAGKATALFGRELPGAPVAAPLEPCRPHHRR